MVWVSGFWNQPNLCAEWATSGDFLYELHELIYKRSGAWHGVYLLQNLIYKAVQIVRSKGAWNCCWENTFNSSSVFCFLPLFLRDKILTGSPFCPLGPTDPGNPGSPESPCRDKTEERCRLSEEKFSLQPQNPAAWVQGLRKAPYLGSLFA